MPSFKIDTSTAIAFVAVPPKLKLVNQKTGEIAVDRETGGRMVTVGLTVADEGEANLLTVTVLESGIAADIAVGTPVTIVGLRARDWENEFNGQKRHGISFRAVAITPMILAAAKG